MSHVQTHRSLYNIGLSATIYFPTNVAQEQRVLHALQFSMQQDTFTTNVTGCSIVVTSNIRTCFRLPVPTRPSLLFLTSHVRSSFHFRFHSSLSSFFFSFVSFPIPRSFLFSIFLNRSFKLFVRLIRSSTASLSHAGII